MGHQYCILEEWQARELLQHLYRQAGSVRRLAEKLGASKSSVHRWLKGEQIPLLYRMKLCEMLPEEELLQVLKGPQLLRQYGLVDEEGRLNKPLALVLLDAMMQDEAMKNEVLSYLLKYYKKELQERLTETLPKIALTWTEDFEKWLAEKKSKPISERTLHDYRNLFRNCLEGKILGWHLLKQLECKQMMCKDGKYHPTGWTRQVFRHYIRWLYSVGRLDWDTYSRLLLVIPGRRYGRKVSQKVIKEEDIVNTIKTLDEKKRGDLLTLYLLILASGVRFMHVLEVFKNWNPDEELYVQYLNRNIRRLECFEELCRYYLGKENQVKPAAFMYFPRLLLPLIKTFAGKLPNRRRIEKLAKKWGCLPPKYIRIFALREMKKVIGDNDVYKFIVGKFGELTVSARHYMDLLEEADKTYPRYISRWLELFNKAIPLEVESGDIIVLRYKNKTDAKQ